MLTEEEKSEIAFKLDEFLKKLGVSLMDYQRNVFLIYLFRAKAEKKKEDQ